MVIILLWLIAAVFLLAHDHNRQMRLEQGMRELYDIEYRHPYPTSN